MEKSVFGQLTRHLANRYDHCSSTRRGTGVYSCHAWPSSSDHTPSHPYGARPIVTGHTNIACTKHESATRCSGSRMRGGLSEGGEA